MPELSKIRISVLLGLSAVCIIGHFLSPPEYTYIHEFLFKLTYLPIVLSALWTSRKVSLMLTVMFCIVYIFHIFEHLFHHAFPHLFSIFLDLGLYFVVAWISGGLSDQQKAHSKKLSEAYAALKEKTAMLLEFEEQALQNERMKTMGELAGTLAHEIRTPLSALQGAVEIVCSENNDEKTRRHFSQMIFKEVTRLDHVVREFLNIGKQPRADLEKVDVAALIERAVALISPIAHKNNVHLNSEPLTPIWVMARVDHLNQVLLNLMMNALHSLSSTGGTIRLATRQEGEWGKIFVEDTGPGVDPTLRPRLFQAFATGRKNGTGLGLYLSRNLMRSFGGDLIFDELEKKCTRFVISLPIHNS
jgi:signal transduction histidine kinase